MKDTEKRLLIRMICDYAPHLKAADLARKTFGELAAIYKALRGY
jgi:hypothetical protein